MNKFFMYVIKTIAIIMILMGCLLILFGDYINNILHINLFIHILLIILSFSIFFYLVFYVIEPNTDMTAKKIRLLKFSYDYGYDELLQLLENYFCKKGYNRILDGNSKTLDFVLLRRKYLFHRMPTYILIYNGNKYDYNIRRTFEKKYYGNYFIINVVKNSLSKKELLEYISYNENTNINMWYGIKRYLNILVDQQKQKVYVSKVLKPNNYNSLYDLSIKKIIIKKFKMKLKEDKKILLTK